MMKKRFEDFCGQCVHAVRSLESGTVCGLTGTRRDFSNGCPDLVIDMAEVEERARREAIRERIEHYDDSPEAGVVQMIIEEGETFRKTGRINWPGLLMALLAVAVLALYIVVGVFYRD